MKQIRIGKDITIHWPILTNGKPEPLKGRDLALFVNPPTHSKIRTGFECDGHVAVFVIRGTGQKATGIYSLTLFENYGKEGQTAVDRCEAFELVATTCKEGGYDTGLVSETIELGSSDLELGIQGPPGFSPVVDVAEDTPGNYRLRITTRAAQITTPNLHGPKFTFGDLTAGDIAVLQQPATDAADQVIRTEEEIKTAETERAEAEKRRQADTAVAIGRTDSSTSRANAATDEALAAVEAITALPVVRTDTDQHLPAAAQLRGRANISAAGCLQLIAAMGGETQNWPLALSTGLDILKTAYALYAADPGLYRWSLLITAAANSSFIEEAELEPVVTSGGIELQFTSKYNAKRYAVVLSAAAGTVAAVKIEYRMRPGQQKYIDQTKINDTVRRAVFNAGSGYWSLNGLTDITEDQMDLVFLDANMSNSPDSTNYLLTYSQARTNIPARSQKGGFRQTCNLMYAAGYGNIEVLCLSPTASEIPASSFEQLGRLNANFKRCLDVIVDADPSTGARTILSGATNAVSVKFKGLKRSITMSDCAQFETEAIRYWIENEAAPSPVTWTLHAACYARCTSDSGIQAALAVHPNVALIPA
ncbi:hypothetical protein [uncultured Alistipes sp.]|uniref:hypothetical protein n=1 Tax=uncultured Alistipes sp. TaxID=538949 RepID=UPI0025DF2319|nr:hypothetical protein [uncultured Alistipes sp.]